MGPRTTLTVDGEYFRRWTNTFFGLPIQGTILPNINGPIPRNRFPGFGDFGFNTRTAYRVGYDLTHQSNNNWSIRNMYRYSIMQRNQVSGGIFTLEADQRTATRSLGGGSGQTSVSRSHFHSMVTNLIGHFRFLDMDHTLLTGVESRDYYFTDYQPLVDGTWLNFRPLRSGLQHQPVQRAHHQRHGL